MSAIFIILGAIGGFFVAIGVVSLAEEIVLAIYKHSSGLHEVNPFTIIGLVMGFMILGSLIGVSSYRDK